MDSVDNYIVGDLPVHYLEGYRLEWIRLDSFNYWKGKPNNSFEEAAEAGIFHREGTKDTVSCIHCRECFIDIEENENIKASYTEWVPQCTGSSFNIPKRYKYLTQFVIDSWFNIYRERYNGVKKSPRVQDASDKFYKEYLVRVNDKSYFDGIDNDLVAFYSNDTKTMDDLTNKEKKHIKSIKEDIKYNLKLTTKSIIEPKQ